MKFFSRATAPSPVKALPVAVNPTDQQQVAFAKYRVDAIARDLEQRKAEGRPQNPHHERMLGEAMMYGHMLVGAGAWTTPDLVAFSARLKKVK